MDASERVSGALDRLAIARDGRLVEVQRLGEDGGIRIWTASGSLYADASEAALVLEALATVLGPDSLRRAVRQLRRRLHLHHQLRDLVSDDGDEPTGERPMMRMSHARPRSSE